MKFNSTLIGIVVLAAVGAGVWWVRHPSPSARQALMASARQAPSVSATALARQAEGDDALPDVTLTENSVDMEDVRITLSLTPQPPVAFAKVRVRVRAFDLAQTTSASSEAGADKMLALEGGRVTFEMSMPMGDHRYSLVPGVDGWQEAEVILPLCPSGKRRWYATVVGTVAGRPRTARFRLDLEPPG